MKLGRPVDPRSGLSPRLAGNRWVGFGDVLQTILWLCIGHILGESLCGVGDILEETL